MTVVPLFNNLIIPEKLRDLTFVPNEMGFSARFVHTSNSKDFSGEEIQQSLDLIKSFCEKGAEKVKLLTEWDYANTVKLAFLRCRLDSSYFAFDDLSIWKDDCDKELADFLKIGPDYDEKTYYPSVLMLLISKRTLSDSASRIKELIKASKLHDNLFNPIAMSLGKKAFETDCLLLCFFLTFFDRNKLAALTKKKDNLDDLQ